MTTPSGWEPRPGPTRGDQARRVPRGVSGWPPDEADPRRQVPRGTGRDRDGAPGDGQGRGAGDGRGPVPRFTPGRASDARNSGPAGQRAPRDGQGPRLPGANGYDRRGLADDFDGRPRSRGEIFTSDRGRPGGPPDGLDSLPSGAPLRWVGTMSTLTAALVLIGATVVGVAVTVIARKEPGNLLGFFIIAGSLAAVLGVRRGAVHLLFPMPALAFFVAAVATGIVHDRQLASSTAGLGASFTQWVAAIFWPAVVATVLVVLGGGGRWLLKRPLVTGRSPLSGGREVPPGNARTSEGLRRPVDPWGGDPAAPRQGTGPTPRQGTGPTPRQGTGPTPRQGTGPTPRQQTGPTPRQGTGPTPRQGTSPTPRQGTGPTPRQGTGPTPQQGNGPTPRQGGGPSRGSANGSRPGRAPRDPRTDRDPWGDPRLPPDRSQPTGPRPQANGRPASQPQPRAPRPETGPGPSFSPAPAPPRRQPPDARTQR
jgi:hypothetical protein